MLVGVGGMLVGAVVGALLSQFGLCVKKKKVNGDGFPQQDVEHNRLLSEDLVTVRNES